MAAVASATEMYVLHRHAIDINRVYLGTDTRSQCLFIGCALAVGLVIADPTDHDEGRLAAGRAVAAEERTGDSCLRRAGGSWARWARSPCGR